MKNLTKSFKNRERRPLADVFIFSYLVVLPPCIFTGSLSDSDLNVSSADKYE